MGLSFSVKPLREAQGITAALVQPWNELVTAIRGAFAQVPRTVFVDLQLRTGDTNRSAFPLEVAMPVGFRPRVVVVGSVRNLDVGDTEMHTQAVFCDWRPSPAGITIRYLTGLFSGAYAPANWALTLRVDGD